MAQVEWRVLQKSQISPFAKSEDLFTLATNHKVLATERNQILLTMILQHKSLAGPKNCINSKNTLIEVIFNGFATPSHSTRKGAIWITPFDD